MSGTRFLRNWLSQATAVALAGAMFVTWPAWTSPSRGVIGDWHHPDMISNHWLYRWIRDQLLSGQGILHNDRYYFPVGDAPWLAGNGSDAIPWLVVGAWMPWPFSITVWMILTVTLNGVAGATLARVAGASKAGTAVAACFLSLFPYVTHEMSGGRFAQTPVYWLVFFLAAWIRHLEAPSWRRGAVAGPLFGATSFIYWYYGLWAALAGGILWLFRPRLASLLRFVPVALLVTLPPLALFLANWSSIPGTTDDVYPHRIALDTSLFATFPVWGALGPMPGLVSPLGLLLLAVAGIRRRWPLVAMGVVALVFYLLALGPYLLGPNGEPTDVPGLFLPAYSWLGVLRRYWWPYRHAAVFTVALVPLGAAGMDRLAGRLGRWGGLAVALVVLLTPLEMRHRHGQIKAATSIWQAPEVYQALGDLPPGAVIELPLNPSIAATQPALGYQWLHGRKMVNGHAMWVDRVRPAAWDEFVKGNSFLRALQNAELGRGGILQIKPADVRALLDLGVRYVVLNTEFFPGRLNELIPIEMQLLDDLFGRPVLMEERLVFVWDMRQYGNTRTLYVDKYDPPDQLRTTEAGRLPQGFNEVSLGWSRADHMDEAADNPLRAVEGEQDTK